MKTKKQKADFVHVGSLLLRWYSENGRDLPFRKTTDPYRVWIAEIIFQQTRISQGLQHYRNFVERFPETATLALATVDEVLLYWKGLGYYSRAINLHKAAQQITADFGGAFPRDYKDILSLKGIGKYTAAAITSICFGEDRPAVDGNLYRVLSRFFADDFDISSSRAFDYFSSLAQRIMPEGKAGWFNQAMMDLGSSLCTPRKPVCEQCPLRENCLAFEFGTVQDFPVKSSMAKVAVQEMKYYFIRFEDQFIVQQRDDKSIWKKLFEFPVEIGETLQDSAVQIYKVEHKLTHRLLKIEVHTIEVPAWSDFADLQRVGGYETVSFAQWENFAFPKPLENFLGEQIALYSESIYKETETVHDAL